MIKLTIAVNNYDDYFTETAEFAVLELSAERIARIKELSTAVARLEADKITIYDHDCDFMVSSQDTDFQQISQLEEFNGRMDFITLNVRGGDFFWSGNYKHVNILWETELIPVGLLDEPGEYDTRTASKN